MIVSVDGIIGVGKSTVLEELQRTGASVYLEPFEKNPVLELFYTDIPRYAALCQAIFFPLRVDMQMAIPSRGIHFIERSAVSDRWCFGQMLKGVMHPREWEGYTIFFDLLSSKFNIIPDLTIIIDESPELCLQRIRERGREMERGITLEYLQNLRAAYYDHREHLGRKVIWADGNELGSDLEWRAIQIRDMVKKAVAGVLKTEHPVIV